MTEPTRQPPQHGEQPEETKPRPSDASGTGGPGHLDASEIGPQPIEPRGHPVLRIVLWLVALMLALAATYYLLVIR
ncbi:MAG TPA: hypothetical protein VKA74_07740 [Myxococcota bacterium]|nr:hypothetical protein [Myxococcota bacterium]